MRLITDIENDIQNKQTELDQTTHEIGRSILINTIADLEIEKKNAEEALSQQNLQERVEQAKVTGYIADTLKANGIPLIELSHTPENYELTAIAFQKWALEQQDAFNSKVSALEDEILSLNIELDTVRDDTLKDLKTIHQHELDIADLGKKLKNAADQLLEKDEEIKKIKEQQFTGTPVEIAVLTAEEQETKLVADLMGNRLKVTSIRFKDESGLDRRKVLANNALTSELIEEYAIYSKTRWEEISEEAAQQLREEYASKKAVIELSIPVLETPAIPFVNEDTRQDEATTDKAPNETDQVDAAGHELAESPSSNQGQVGEAESEVITLESLDARLKALEANAGKWAA